MAFVIFLDEVGAEYASAKVTRRGIRPAGLRQRFRPFRPLPIRPLEVQEERGAARRAATGYLLLGAGGAAAGVLMGKGQHVLFELECADGITRKGMVAQKRYPAMRRAVERIRRYREGDERRLFWRWFAYIGGAIVLTAAEQNPFFLFAIVPGMLIEVALDRWRLSRPVEAFSAASVPA